MMPKFGNSIVIPKIVDNLSNGEMIVMEYINGVKILDGLIKYYTLQAQRMGFTRLNDLIEKGQFSWFEKMQMAIRMGAFWVYDSIHYATAALVNNTIFFYRSVPMSYPTAKINEKKLYKMLLQVHGYQILITRLFNGDCHMGNILLTNDSKIALIDYGQVKAISKHDARNYAQMLRLIKESRRDEALILAKEMGFETERNNDYVLWKTLQVCIDSDSREACEGMNLQAFMEKLSKEDRTKSIPDQYVFAVRASILLRGLGQLMGFTSVSLADEWKELVEQALTSYPIGAFDDHKVVDFTIC